MAPKRSAAFIVKPPAAASSDDEEESSAAKEEEEEEEDGLASSSEESGGTPPKPFSPEQTPTQTPIKTATKKPEPDSASDSDTESEQPRSNRSAVAKRGSEIDRNAKESKRAKNADGVADKSEDSKKFFQRVWSKDDEIAVLKGLISFSTKKGIDASKDMSAFHEFIKKSLHFDVNLGQLKDKVWRLKKKYLSSENKANLKPHDQKIFELGSKIWGDLVSNGGGGARSVYRKSTRTGGGGGGDINYSAIKEFKFDNAVSFAGLEDNVMKMSMNMVEGEKKEELERKWEKLNVTQLELFIQRNELINEQAKLILAAYKREEED